jgi:succinate dehydrogenase / fumarate reductase membrane anchor subunit
MFASRPKPFESSLLWLLKLASGVLVFILILVHIIVNHLVVSGGLMNYAEVIRYLSNPWIAFMESAFLVIVVSHSLLGTRSVILDLNPGARFIRAIDLFFMILGSISIIYGIWLIRVIVSQPSGG